MSPPDKKRPTKSASTDQTANRWGSNKRVLQQDDGRRAIINAAVGCFEQKGVNSTTIEEIAKTANITRRTVYHYFKSKNDILAAAAEQHACDTVTKMAEEVSGDQPFTDFVTDCLAYMIDKMPKEAFYKLQIREDIGLRAGYFNFTSGRVKGVWVDAFQGPYIEALRQRSINPELHLEDILVWIGRIVLSYLQYPTPQTSTEETRRELQLFFTNALKYGA